MDAEGGAAEPSKGEAPRRYYVVSGGQEKGPYTVEQLRLAVEETALSATTRVRAEDEEKVRPLGPLLAAAPRPAPRARRRRARAGADTPETVDEVYDQLRDEEDRPLPGRHQWGEHEGSLMTGFLLGFVGGCLALALTRNAKPQTRKGVIMGFAVGLILGIVVRFANTF